MSAKNPLPSNRHFDCINKCQARVWGCIPACERLHRPCQRRQESDVADELSRLRADRDAKSTRMWELGKECDKLRAELAALQADARRYRFLRDTYATQQSSSYVTWSTRLPKGHASPMNAASFDAAIDAAALKESAKCEHGKGLTDYCLPCGRVSNA